MKKILVPTDFSENATDALAYALKFAQGTNSNIHIVHVVNSNIVSAESALASAEIIKANIENAQEEMKAIKMFCNAHQEENRKEYKITTLTLVGSIPNMIKEEAKNIKADLIIMGTRGKNYRVLDNTFGSASFSVLDQAPCPVLVVPKNYQYKPIENVIFATNLNHGDPFDLWRANEILNPHSVVIQCLYVVKDEESKDQSQIDLFSKYMVEHSPSLKTMFHTEVGKDIVEIISEFSDTYEAEMIIMHRSKKSIWAQIFTKRHTNNMVRRIDRPLLVINE